MYPVITFLFIKNNMKRLNDPDIKRKFGSLFEDLRLDSKLALYYNGIFMVSRIIISLILVFGYSYPLLQVSVIIGLSYF